MRAFQAAPCSPRRKALGTASSNLSGWFAKQTATPPADSIQKTQMVFRTFPPYIQPIPIKKERLSPLIFYFYYLYWCRTWSTIPTISPFSL